VFLREAGPREVLVGAMVLLALSLLALSLSVVWYGVLSSRQAAERALREEAPLPQEPQPEGSPLIFSEPSDELAEATSADGRLRGIPGLADMELIGSLPYLPGTNFRCPGGTPYQGLLTKRTCRSSTGSDPPVVYEATIIEESPSTVLSVHAVARNAPDEAAADFLGYVLGLSLKDAAPSLDAEAWVDRNIESGGQYFADGAEVRFYGTPGDRTLEIVATPSPADRGPVTVEVTTDRGTADRRPK
jgi:hypothetical protein